MGMERSRGSAVPKNEAPAEGVACLAERCLRAGAEPREDTLLQRGCPPNREPPQAPQNPWGWAGPSCMLGDTKTALSLPSATAQGQEIQGKAQELREGPGEIPPRAPARAQQSQPGHREGIYYQPNPSSTRRRQRNLSNTFPPPSGDHPERGSPGLCPAGVTGDHPRPILPRGMELEQRTKLFPHSGHSQGFP